MKWYVNSVGAPVIEADASGQQKVVGVLHVTLRPVGFDPSTIADMGPHPDGTITLARVNMPGLKVSDCFELVLSPCDMPKPEEKKA